MKVEKKIVSASRGKDRQRELRVIKVKIKQVRVLRQRKELVAVECNRLRVSSVESE